MRILDKLRISAPQKSVPDSSTPLTFLDATWIDFKPVKRCFFYTFPHPTPQFLKFHLPKIKSSLSLTLHNFYPLAGKLRLSPGSDQEQYEICYRDGDSVSLDVVESKDNFLHLSETKPHDTSKIQLLVPEQNGDDLLAIQLTIFPNHGICIGFSIHHVACDGFSHTHFVKSWASICKSGLPLLLSTMVPSIDRTVLDGLHEFYPSFVKRRKEYKNMTHKSEITSDTLSTIFRISIEQIEGLKISVHAKAKSLQKQLPYCSTYMMSSAYAWSCHVKMRKYSDDQKVCFLLPVDWRRRLEPPAPAMYFGNCVLHSFVVMKAGDLVKDDGVTLACEAIGNRIKELEGGIVSFIKRGAEDHAIIHEGNYSIFAIAGSNRFGVYGVDFGWGQPIKVEIFVKEEGIMFMAENGDESGLYCQSMRWKNSSQYLLRVLHFFLKCKRSFLIEISKYDDYFRQNYV